MNRHIHIVTDDIRWAISFAGAVFNAKSDIHGKINGPFGVSFEPTTPEIAYLATYFDAKPENAVDWSPPLPEHYPIIDEFARNNHMRELEEQHGIKQDLPLVPLYVSDLAANSMIIAHNVYCKPDYFYPNFSKRELDAAPKYDIIVESKANVAQATAFARGMGLENPTVISAEDVDIFTAFKIVANGCKLVFTRPNHSLQHYLRSKYKGYDNLANETPAITLINDTVKQDDRFLVSWAGQIPVFENEPNENIAAKGKAYSIRRSYDFNHRKFFKDHAEGKVKV